MQVGQQILYKGDMANSPGVGIVVAVCEVGPSYGVNWATGKMEANPREAYDVRLVDGRSFRAVNAGNIGGTEADKSCRFMWVPGLLNAAELAVFNEAWADTVIEKEAAKAAAAATQRAQDSAKCAGLDVKFQKYYVAGNGAKAKVWYSLDNRIDGRKCVTLYAKDYDRALGKVFAGAGYVNETDLQTDYFDKGKVVLFEGNPLYAAARARAESKVAA